jgi:iron(III) transport system ATP-binding protein
MPEIHVDGLVKTFGEQRALDHVTFAVEDGELFTLLGPSGCGKSTTLMSIAGFQSPDEGRIAVGDQAFFDAARGLSVAAERRNLGIVFQSYAVWPHMTVFENLAFPLKVRKLGKRETRDRVLEVLDLVEMRPFEKRYPHQLSGGQQQRVALGRALVYSPSVLLLDEPFSNLDAKLRERARTWVKELQQTLGLTTIFVTHDQDEALSMSDRVVVMSAGRVQQIGTPEAVYRTPANRFVAEFVGRVNLIDGVIASQDGAEVLVDIDASHRLAVATADGTELPRDVTIAVRPEAMTVAPGGDGAVDGANTWEAEVHAVAFLGDHYEYEVDSGAIHLTVQSARRVTGDRITVHIPPDACAVVSRS